MAHQNFRPSCTGRRSKPEATTPRSARDTRLVHSVLTGEQTAPAAAAALERELVTLTGYRSGAPKNPQ